MSSMTNDSLILKIVDLLISKEVSTQAITDTLTLIVNHFDFRSSFVYEKDQYNQFSLREHIVSNDKKIRNIFLFEQLPDELQKRLVSEPMIYLHEDMGALEKKICNLFKVESIVMYLVVDGAQQSLGMIVFTNSTQKPKLEEEKVKYLRTSISLLSKYVSRRMYASRVSFAVASLESILDNTGIDIYVNDFYNHDILYVNKSMAAPYGGREEFMGNKCWAVLFPEQNGPCEFCPQKQLVDENGLINKVYTWDYQRAFDGSWFRVFSAAFRWIDGRLAHVVSSADITDNKKYEAMVHHLANYDVLTNLPNRRKLIGDCERKIEKATKMENGYILFFDIDGFKQINDNYGHESGDEFLVQLAAFLSDIPMIKDSVYRNGGDEFIILIGGEDLTKVNIHNLARFILQRFEKPWKLKKGDIYCNTSIGIACFPEDGNETEQLIHMADQAMYHVKKLGGANICFANQLKKEQGQGE